MHSKQWYFKLLLILALPAVMWLFINASINIHIHQLSDGTCISHSHPYNKNAANKEPFAAHQHSKKQYQLLQIMSLPDTVTIAVFLLGFSLQIVCKHLKFSPITIKTKNEYYGVLTYRGPPAC